MELYLDTADLQEIETYAAILPLRGVTTNPTIVARAGRPLPELINAFEENLTLAGTRILKFYLHISPEEQLARFAERLEVPEKHWKLNLADYAARDDWDAYAEAYEDAIDHCNSDDSPWFVVPADRKWYRNAAVASIVLETLLSMNPQMPSVGVDLDEIRGLYERELVELNDKKRKKD